MLKIFHRSKLDKNWDKLKAQLRRFPKPSRLDTDWKELMAMSDDDLVAEFNRLDEGEEPDRFRRACEVMGIRFYQRHILAKHRENETQPKP